MLTKILNPPLVGHTNSFISNSSQFVDEIKNWVLQPTDLMVSFDVKSLFTNVPINDAMVILRERLEMDESLGDRTAMSPLQICDLTDLCLNSTYFSFQGQIYKQLKGTAMGSPLSPVIANIFMEDFEQTALVTADYQPRMWKRYVDDTFVIWPHGEEKLDAFLGHINTLHPNITFTLEKEKDNKIAFLDVLIERKSNTLETSVPTHTNQYLNYRSHHHPQVKLGIVQCLKQRANKICSEKNVKAEKELLEKVFVANGYPSKRVSEAMDKEKTSKEGTEGEEEEEEGKKLLVLPYIQGLSEKITKTCRRFNIKTAFTSRPTLRNLLCHVKGKPPPEARLGIVYGVPCNCGRTYIGETGRCLSVRIQEHKRAVRILDTRNTLATHIAEFPDHSIEWEKSSIKEYESNWYRRKVKEGIWIKMTENNLNTDRRLTINATWNTMLHRESDGKMSGATIRSKTPPTSATGSTVSADLTGPCLVTT